MRHHPRWLGAALLAGASLAACQDQAQTGATPAAGSPSRIPDSYDLIDLGALPGDTYSRPTAINNRSEVAGYSFQLFSYETIRGFRWNKAEGMTELGSLPDYSWVLTGDINDNGQIAGSMYSYHAGPARAFVWEEGALSIIEPPAGATFTEAFGINDEGAVAGRADFAGDGNPRAFLFDDGELVDLGVVEGGTYSQAYGINDGGEIVGYGDNADGQFVGLLWVNGGERMIDLSTVLSIPDFLPYAIGPEGHLVGYSASLGHAVFIGAEREAIDLGSLVGPEGFSEAYDVNSAGQVVGSSDGPMGDYRAFVWDEGEMVDLNELIDPGAQVQLIDAMSINEQGEIAVFGYSEAGYAYHTYLLRPVISP